MEWEQIRKQIIEKCNEAHKSKQYQNKLLEYSKNLYDKQLPILTCPLHLSKRIGIDHNYVCSMAHVPQKFYRHFYIQKANGKKRHISEPLPDLKFVQHWILHNILEKNPISSYAKAFYKKRTLKENARFHRAQKVVVSLDIKDFFPSISSLAVYAEFLKMGYSVNLCSFLADLCCYEHSLPQGAPTSPYLSNLCMRSFDNEVTKYINTKHIRYTRYADDLTFSGDFNPHVLIHDISKLLYQHGFQINPDKTRVAYQNARQEVTGIVVNSHMQIEKKKRKAIRQQVYYIKKYGLDSHLNHIHETRAHYINHLLGQIGYALFVNPKDKEMKEYYELIKSIKKENSDSIA